MGTTPKNAKKPVPQRNEDDKDLGLWMDSRLLSKHLKQPSESMFQPSADRLLHFADLALGSVKPDRFRSEKVSKERRKA